MSSPCSLADSTETYLLILAPGDENKNYVYNQVWNYFTVEIEFIPFAV